MSSGLRRPPLDAPFVASVYDRRAACTGIGPMLWLFAAVAVATIPQPTDERSQGASTDAPPAPPEPPPMPAPERGHTYDLTPVPRDNGHTVKNGEPSAAELKEKHRLRLVEIDQELVKLQTHLSSGEVFLDTERKLGPWFLIGGAPLMVIGFAFGYGSKGTTYSSGDHPDAFGTSLVYMAGIFAGVAAINLLICLGRLIDHWITEADEAPSRQGQIDALRAEQTSLLRR